MKDRTLTVLIIYARFGDGHYQVSKALEQQFAAQGQADVHLVDIFEEAHPVMNAIFRYAYAKSMTWFPKAYGYSYSVTNGMKHDHRFGKWLHALGRRKLTEIIQIVKPDVIVHTFPFLAAYPVMEATGISIPSYTVITDYDLHTRWVHPRTDGYFVASDALKEQLSAMGVREDRIHVTGIPVRQQFRSRPGSRTEICRAQGLDPARSYVLVMVGALTEPAKIIEELLTLDPSVSLLLVAGRNAKLHRRLMARYAGSDRLHVIGFSEHMEGFMSIAACIVTKAGAVTLTEAISMRVPVVVFRPIPGQEQGNADYWEARQALRTATDAATVRAAVQQFVSGQGDYAAIDFGDATLAIVREVLNADAIVAARTAASACGLAVLSR